MLDIKLDVDATHLSKQLIELEKRHLPFAAALTATRLAQRVKAGSLEVMRRRLDRPTPTTMNSLFVRMATKSRPAKVYFKDSWTSGVPADTYLQQVVAGGERPHKRFERALIGRGLMQSGQFAIPNPNMLNQYGNVSRGTITRLLSALGAAETMSGYQANATGSKRSRRKGNARVFFAGKVDGQAGIWERQESAFGDAVRPVFVFSSGAPRYRTIFPFFKVAENIIRAHHPREFAKAFDEAVRSAR